MASPNGTTESKGVVLQPASAVYAERERPSRFNSRKAAVFLADLNAVASSLLVAGALHQAFNSADPVSGRSYFWFFVATFFVWPISFTRQLLYRSRHIARSADEAERVVKAILYGFVGVIVISIFLGDRLILAPSLIALAFFIMLIIVGIERGIAR
ncbi:MAG: hypothetical protein KJO18_07605, partial [Acidimicrobiia bacterium]|nr:hypothetical protein [Acidimicrobiia bacterium]